MKRTIISNRTSLRFAALSSLLKLKGEEIIGDRALLPPLADEDFKRLP